MESIEQQIQNLEISKKDADVCGKQETTWMKIDKSEAPNKFIEYVDEITKQDQVVAHTRYSTKQLRLQPGNKVIDVGCGAGKDLSRLESMVESNGQVCGIDLSREMVECAKSRMSHLPNVTVFCANAAMIPIEADYFDASRCERLLQHIPQPEDVVNEMVRITKTGGRVVLTDVDWWSSTISVPRSIDRINTIIIKDVVFNQHPSIGLNLRGLMSKTTNIEEVETFAQCLYTDSLTIADDLLWLGERGKMAIQQGLITEEEYNQWRETIEEMEENGSFVFTINLFTVSGTVNKQKVNSA